MAKAQSYLADIGDSCAGPIGACIRVRAASKAEALAQINRILDTLADGIRVPVDGAEQVHVFFNGVLTPAHLPDSEVEP